MALAEEGFFKPVFDWHEARGMIYGCDHGGRGYDVTEFGDYFRTQRWNQGPGCDQPALSATAEVPQPGQRADLAGAQVRRLDARLDRAGEDGGGEHAGHVAPGAPGGGGDLPTQGGLAAARRAGDDGHAPARHRRSRAAQAAHRP